MLRETNKLIDLSSLLVHPVSRTLYRCVEHPVEKLFSLDSINTVYRDLAAQGAGQNFFRACLDRLNITLDINAEGPIPGKGPCVVVSNHPFGGLEGIILGYILTHARSDVRFLGNYILHNIPEIRQYVFPVDPFQSQGSAIRNIKALKQTLQWLAAGGMLCVFPSGTVSHLALSKRRITDPPWSHHTASIIRRTGATVLPVFFDGRNSHLFQLLGLIHPRLRTVMLPHELINKQQTAVSVFIGSTVPFTHLSRFQSDAAMIDYLRLRTYVLKNKKRRSPSAPAKALFIPVTAKKPAKIALRAQSNVLQEEIDALPPAQHLLKSGDFSVCWASAHQAPRLLQDIGRLRETCFREVGEGTGNSRDIDRFDRYYLHLFMWNRRTKEIAGGYRLGVTDEILPRYGLRGLYTHTLFKFKHGFPATLGPSIELGRSFISPNYQKKYNSLALLWRGIGAYISCNPSRAVLFGPVSISNSYHRLSKNLMVQFLQPTNTDAEWCRSVRPRTPVRNGRLHGIERGLLKESFPTIDHVSALISEIEADGKGIPVLLRHYLRLNGTILSFNVDKRFSRVIDGLIVVDLRKTERRLLQRFMGESGMRTFLHFHRESDVSHESLRRHIRH